MINFLERAGERLLSKLVPSATASAACPPDSWCADCPHSGGRKQIVRVQPNCSLSYGTCLLNAC
jgi:hypothetical protein